MQFFTGPEKRYCPRRDEHGSACSRIASVACLAPLHGKCPEAPQLYTVSLSESPGDLPKDGIDDLLNISLIEMRIPSPEAQYQLGLDHGVLQPKVTVVYG